jgi:hypothetical protein
VRRPLLHARLFPTRTRALTEWKPFDLRSRKRRPDGRLDHMVDDGKDDYCTEARQSVGKRRERSDAMII